jgi:hypothetical protein
MSEQLPVITLWQPWATWVMAGWKTIETRTHPRFACLVGQRIGIHAGLHWDQDAIRLAQPYLTNEQVDVTKKYLRIGGGIIGTVKVTMHRELHAEDSPAALINCEHTRRWGLFLVEPRIIEAIPVRGKQGIWIYKATAVDE